MPKTLCDNIATAHAILETEIAKNRTWYFALILRYSLHQLFLLLSPSPLSFYLQSLTIYRYHNHFHHFSILYFTKCSTQSAQRYYYTILFQLLMYNWYLRLARFLSARLLCISNELNWNISGWKSRDGGEFIYFARLQSVFIHTHTQTLVHVVLLNRQDCRKTLAFPPRTLHLSQHFQNDDDDGYEERWWFPQHFSATLLVGSLPPPSTTKTTIHRWFWK